MRPIKELISLSDSDLSDLEIVVKTFLNVDTEKKAIQLARKLSLSEIKEGLTYYNLISTEGLWQEAITLNNLKAYLTSEHGKEIATQFIKQSDEFKVIKGIYNVPSHTFKSESSLIGEALSLLNPLVTEKDITRLKNVSESIGTELSSVPAFLKRESDISFELSLEDEKEESAEWLSKISSPVPAMLVVAAMFPSVSQADDHSSKAVNAAAKATLIQTGYDKKAAAFAKAMGKKAEAAINEGGDSARIPAAVVGFGVKTAVEGKIAFKGNNPIMDGKYEVSVSPSSAEVKMIDTDNVNYWFKTRMSSETRVEIGVNFDF